MILAIDFDGTIVHNKFPAIGELLPNSKEVINQLYDNGHYIIIWTSRDGAELLKAINFLIHTGIKFHRINDNNPVNTEKYGSNSRKVYAHMYIDDHNMEGFSGWERVLSAVEQSESNHFANL